MKKHLIIVSILVGIGVAISSVINSLQIDQNNVLTNNCVDLKEFPDEMISQHNLYIAALNQTLSDVEYIDKYYSTNDGKPPENEGVCTDVIWRSFERVGVDIKELIDKDIQNYPQDYPLDSWGGISDSNIDFRRVPNLEVFLRKYSQVLPNEIFDCNMDNLSTWQAGDIVIFSLDGVGPSDHIAIVSDKRNENGVPYIIHNWGRGVVEDQNYWGEIKGHYRYSNSNNP